MVSKQKLVHASLKLVAACIGLLLLLGIAVFILVAVRYDPLKLAHGEIASNARLVIQLPEKTSLAKVHPRFVKAAQLGGFLFTYGTTGVCTSEELSVNREGCIPKASNTWYEGDIDIESWGKYRSVFFLIDTNYDGKFDPTKAISSTITFVLAKNNTDSFTKKDWETFFNYKDNILPKLFPDAVISIHKTRHPAVFTDDEILRQIQRETDFQIPEKYLPKPKDP